MHTRISQVLALKGHAVYDVSLESSVCQAARKMVDRKIGSVIVRSNGQVVGILTERDLARRVCVRTSDPAATPVSEVMTWPVAFVTPNTTVAEAMKVMSDTHCRHMPVFEEGKLVGLVSLGDLVRSVTVDLATDVQYLKDYIVKG